MVSYLHQYLEPVLEDLSSQGFRSPKTNKVGQLQVVHPRALDYLAKACIFTESQASGDRKLVSPEDVLLTVLFMSHGESAQQKEKPPKPSLKPLSPRSKQCAFTSSLHREPEAKETPQEEAWKPHQSSTSVSSESSLGQWPQGCLESSQDGRGGDHLLLANVQVNWGPPCTRNHQELLVSVLYRGLYGKGEPIPERSMATAVALGTFPVGDQSELSLRLGEPLTIISEDGDWWTVLSEVSGREYSIPSIHAAKVSHGWLYEGLSREKAEELLLLPGNPGGAFLIRESQSRRGCYSLSVRLSRPTSWDRIRHYRIQRLDNGWLYISPCLTFPSLQALVDHYCELADDICCPLKEPCVLQRTGPLPNKALPPPVTVQRPPLNWKELDSSILFSEASTTEESSVLSEGLREALTSYLSLTEDISTDATNVRIRGRKGN